MSVIIILGTAVALVVALFWRRRHRAIAPVPAPVPPAATVNLGDARRQAAVGEMHFQNEEAVRDFQAKWLREQQLITADSVIDAVQGVRSTITHVGEKSPVRAVLDHLEQQAKDCPAGVPGSVVASARLEFDRLLRGQLQ
jgi:hypothetical protein